mmetsp:Transcript_21942/g.37330  ORF Transcript_21942/g.37330 Transcript_21942/m.37330 type:complete len:113 (-) Transcript_21942:235-573(-)
MWSFDFRHIQHLVKRGLKFHPKCACFKPLFLVHIFQAYIAHMCMLSATIFRSAGFTMTRCTPSEDVPCCDMDRPPVSDPPPFPSLRCCCSGSSSSPSLSSNDPPPQYFQADP